jgi:hypothetical protein
MKVVVFEHPRIASYEKFNDIASTPLWSCLMGGYVAAGLQAGGAEVIYLDHARPGTDFAASLSRLLSLSPELLAVNAVYFWEHSVKMFDFFQALRDRGFSGHLNLFGFFPSLVYQEILLNTPSVDSIAVGECEHTLAALWRALQNGGRQTAIAGLATRDRDGTVRYQPRPVEKDPDLFPPPLRPESADPTVTLLASRGCYNRCSFCLIPPFDAQHGGWRGRSPEHIAGEIRSHRERGCSTFYFSDPNFIGPGKKGRERTLRLLDMLKELDITYGMETRPNDLDDDMMKALVYSGLTSLLMGVESGSAGLLRHINKHSSAETAATAISLCRKYGIDPEIGFLMFLPDGGLDDLKMNYAFLRENKLLTRLDRTANLFCHRQIVLRGTAGYESFRRSGRLTPSGVFDFEGVVSFRDPGVEPICEVVLFACHTVLREMMDESSPVYWQNPDPGCSDALNTFLTELFPRSLTTAGDIEVNREKDLIRREISAISGMFSAPAAIDAQQGGRKICRL